MLGPAALSASARVTTPTANGGACLSRSASPGESGCTASSSSVPLDGSVDAHGDSALTYAGRWGRVDVIKALQAKVEPDLCSRMGRCNTDTEEKSAFPTVKGLDREVGPPISASRMRSREGSQ